MPSTRLPLHRRSIQYEAFDGGDAVEVVGTLVDTRPWAEDGRSILTVHDMELRVTVRVSDLTITAASAEMRTFPHVECPGITEAFAGLAGLSVTTGLHPCSPEPVRWPEGLHPSGAAGPLARSGRHPGHYVPPGPGCRRRATPRTSSAMPGVPGRVTPATSGPREVLPTRSSLPGGDRGWGRTPHPAVVTFREEAPAGEVGRGGRPRRLAQAVVPTGGAGHRGPPGCVHQFGYGGEVALLRHPPRPPVRSEVRGEGGVDRRARAGAGGWTGDRPLPVRDRRPGHAISLLRHLRGPVAPGRPSRPGCRSRWPDQA